MQHLEVMNSIKKAQVVLQPKTYGPVTWYEYLSCSFHRLFQYILDQLSPTLQE